MVDSRHLEKIEKSRYLTIMQNGVCIGGPPSWILKMNFNGRCI